MLTVFDGKIDYWIPRTIVQGLIHVVHCGAPPVLLIGFGKPMKSSSKNISAIKPNSDIRWLFQPTYNYIIQ